MIQFLLRNNEINLDNKIISLTLVEENFSVLLLKSLLLIGKYPSYE